MPEFMKYDETIFPDNLVPPSKPSTSKMKIVWRLQSPSNWIENEVNSIRDSVSIDNYNFIV